MKGVCSNSSLIKQMTLRGVFYGPHPMVLIQLIWILLKTIPSKRDKDFIIVIMAWFMA